MRYFWMVGPDFCPRDTCLAAFVQPRKSQGQRRNFGTSTESAFFVPVLIETIHTCAYFIDSDSLMARATCNCGRVRREHFGKWPPGRQESCGSRSTAAKRTLVFRAELRLALAGGACTLPPPQRKRH